MMRWMRWVVAVLFTSVSALAQTTEGRFGRAIDSAAKPQASVAPVYTVVPIAVELWAKLSGEQDHVLIANEEPNSGTHWQLFTDKQGRLSTRLPGYKPDTITSSASIIDDEWHYLALVFDGESARLYVDATEVANTKVEKFFRYPNSTPLTIGHLLGKDAKPGTVLDEIRISRVARTITEVPSTPFTADKDTIALWHFDEPTGPTFADASKTNNPVTLSPAIQTSDMTAGSNRWMQMDVGPFFSSTLGPKPFTTHKAVSVKLGDRAAVALDTEHLRVSAFWTGDFLKIHPAREGLAGPPDIAGRVQFSTKMMPGWLTPSLHQRPTRGDGTMAMPKDVGHYRGLYVHGQRVIFSCRIEGTDVLETHDLEGDERFPVLARTIHLAAFKAAGPLVVRLFDPVPGQTVLTRIVDAPAGPDARLKAQLGDNDGGLLSLPSSNAPVTVKVLIAAATRPDSAERFANVCESSPKPIDLPSLIRGSPSRYPEVLTTKGALGTADGPYVVDTLTAPDDNPWKSFLRFGGHDFFDNGDLAICSVSGDVWVVSGIDEKLEHLRWRRYATGLFQPLGLKIVEGKVYVLGRDQITRLHDLNADGEADFYENFNNDANVTTNGHAYCTGLDTDPHGNFYFVKCADNSEHGGTMLRVSSDGSRLDVVATGLRNPNGSGVSPDGIVTAADNQGEWVPASRIDVVTQGEFLGYTPMAKTETPPTHPGHPLVWMPQNVDNSSGGQAWVTSDRWGLPRGTMVHTSYGAAALLYVMHEKVNDVVDQGGVVRLPLTFATGIMRARFGPKDGQLYVSGLKGWQTAGSRDGALQRVRFTGKPLRLPVELHAHQNGLLIRFSDPLDAKTATDPENWSILQWNYRWTKNYGSRHWSVENPNKQGYDTVEVKSAWPLPDGRSVFLEIPSIQPVMQMQVGYVLEATDGTPLKGDIFNTIHALAPPFRARGFIPNDRVIAPFGVPARPEPAAKPAARPSSLLSRLFGQPDTPEARTAPPRSTPANPAMKKIVLIAGKKSHGPGEHEYEKGVRLLKHCLDTSPNLKGFETTVVLDGWPDDPKILDDVSTIFLFCDGADRDEKAHPLLHADRLQQMQRLMDKGVGLCVMHYTVFLPTERGGKQFLDWVGGYFDYDSAGNDRAKWFSKLGTANTTSTPLSPDHPILRGVTPFKTRTEYYWNIRFRDNDPRLTPLITFDPNAPGRSSVVAWAIQRNDGGRGFAFTEGHFHSNWQVESFRRLVLNGLVWTAKGEVPAGGVESTIR